MLILNLCRNQKWYNYLEHFSEFLRIYQEQERWCRADQTAEDKEIDFMQLWYKHLKEIIIELFNNFIHGNLLSVAAMTRTLIECYVYISILIQEQNPKLKEDWFLCSLMKKVRDADSLKSTEKDGIMEQIKTYCNVRGCDFSEVYGRFYEGEENKNKKKKYISDNEWLSDIIKEKSITFKKVCEYLGKDSIYKDYQALCTFVHGQDAYTKMLPFTFYSSIYEKMLLMSIYTFESIRLFEIDDELENTIQNLEEELYKLGEEYLKNK